MFSLAHAHDRIGRPAEARAGESFGDVSITPTARATRVLRAETTDLMSKEMPRTIERLAETSQR